jgi:hypothetical protein
VGIIVGKVAVGQIFIPVFPFGCHSTSALHSISGIYHQRYIICVIDSAVIYSIPLFLFGEFGLSFITITAILQVL